MNGRRMILGMGTGRCGTRSLATLLSRQPGTRVTHEETPLLPWKVSGQRPGIDARLERMQRMRKEPVIGDVASFYLPYVERIMELVPDVRVLCLKRPREEVVRSFCRWIEKVHPLPTNHWAKNPAPGWYHEPFWTRIFPQYDTPDPAQGIRQYWDEYYQRAEALAAKYTQNLRIFDSQEALNNEAAQRELLAFCGFSREQQVIALDIRENDGDKAPQRQAPARFSPNPNDPRRCAILVPFSGHIVQQCEDALKELERRGYPVRRVSGYAAIDQGRNQMVTDALLDGFEETMWIDADVSFHPDAVDLLRSHRLPITCGIYPQKGKRAIACHIMPGTPRLVFGKDGGLCELLFAGTGFLHVRREVYERIQHELDLPVCNERFARPMIPFFHPMLHPFDEGHWYLAEDYAFCQRARSCRFKIVADTRIRLWHVGTYSYGWEDAGIERDRHATFTLHFPEKPPPPSSNGQPMPPPRRQRQPSMHLK